MFSFQCGKAVPHRKGDFGEEALHACPLLNTTVLHATLLRSSCTIMRTRYH